MRKFYKFLFFSCQKKKLLGQSFILIWMIRISLWLFRFQSLNKWLLRLSSPEVQEVNWVEVKDIVQSVRACSRFVPYASCLTQALTARTLLRFKGQDPQLKFGVDKDESGQFSAHAWLEINERIIIGKLPNHSRFSVLNPVQIVVL